MARQSKPRRERRSIVDRHAQAEHQGLRRKSTGVALSTPATASSGGKCSTERPATPATLCSTENLDGAEGAESFPCPPLPPARSVASASSCWIRSRSASSRDRFFFFVVVVVVVVVVILVASAGDFVEESHRCCRCELKYCWQQVAFDRRSSKLRRGIISQLGQQLEEATTREEVHQSILLN